MSHLDKSTDGIWLSTGQGGGEVDENEWSEEVEWKSVGIGQGEERPSLPKR
jgi:hypothetical protein